MQKRALAVHDFSCVGRCSLTVALPVLSAAGLNTSAIPTALLSTHTGEFTGYTHLDLSEEMNGITGHLSTLDIHYDCFYSGYLAGSRQVKQVLEMIDRLCDEETHLFVDPAFADQGRMYSLMDDRMPEQMRRLCSRADTIVPNLTEARLLLGLPCTGEHPSENEVRELCAGLCDMGPKQVIITDVSFEKGLTGIAAYAKGETAPRFMMKERIPRVFYGTGDVFASFLLGALMNGKQPGEAAEIALDMTHRSIEYTLADGLPLRYGVQFEKALPEYISRLEM